MATFKTGKRSKTRHNGGIIRQTLKGWFVGEVNTNGTRHRSQPFSDEQAAKDWIDNRIKAKDEHGKQVLDGEKSVDAKAALAILKQENMPASLKEAVEFYAKHHRQIADAWTVAECMERFLAKMTASKRRPRSIKNKRTRLASFIETHGAQKIPEITAADVETWLASTGAQGRNLQNYQGEIQSLFNFAAKNKMPGGYVNTVAKYEVEASPERAPAEIVEPRHVKSVLHWIEKRNPRAAVGLAVACFAGLRTSELVHGGGLQWSDIDFDEQLIVVPASLSKTRDRREVKIMPNLMEWLLKYRSEGRVTLTEDKFNEWRKRARKATGAVWPDNGARHSFGTYFAKLNGYRDASDQIGHKGGIAMLKAHYSGKCTKAQAEEFFQIVPATQGKILRHPAAATA